jgi:hypothetical protein
MRSSEASIPHKTGTANSNHYYLSTPSPKNLHNSPKFTSSI